MEKPQPEQQHLQQQEVQPVPDVQMHPASPIAEPSNVSVNAPPNDAPVAVSENDVIMQAAPTPPQLPAPSEKPINSEDIEPASPDHSPEVEEAPSTQEYPPLEIFLPPRTRRSGRRTKSKPAPTAAAAAAPPLDDEDVDLLEEVLRVTPMRVETNIIDRLLRDAQKKENWSYDPDAATKKLEDIQKKAALAVLEDEEEMQERRETQKLLKMATYLTGEPLVEQRYFVKPAKKVLVGRGGSPNGVELMNPQTDDQKDMLLFLERAELRSREFLLQLDKDKLFPWLFGMMAYSPSEFLAIRALQALQYLLFNFEDEAYLHGPLSGGYLPPRKTRQAYTLSPVYASYLGYFLLEDILSNYGPESEDSQSQQREGRAPIAFLPAHNLSLVIRFVTVEILATPCCISVSQRKHYFVLFCRMLLDPLIASAINCIASLQSALDAICVSFTPEEWRANAPIIAASAKACVVSHILLRDLLRHFPSGERVLELRARICCLFLEPQHTQEDIQASALIIGALNRILEEFRSNEQPDPSVLLTKIVCIDLLTDSLILQFDTQAERLKEVKRLVIDVNGRLRDRLSIIVSILKNKLIEFENRLDLYLRRGNKNFVQVSLLHNVDVDMDDDEDEIQGEF